jgi:hypothetical protein
MLTKAELTTALHGLWGLLRLHPEALNDFDATLHGFWRPYWLAAMLLPAWMLMLWGHPSATPLAHPNSYVAMQGIGYVVGWFAYPLLMTRVADFLDRGPRYFTYMVPYNWFGVAQTVVWLVLNLIGDSSGIAPAEAVLLWLIPQTIFLGYGWFIAKHALDLRNGTAAALVAIDFLLSVLIDALASGVS